MIKTETICEPAPLRKVATLACILIEPLRENEWTCPSSEAMFQYNSPKFHMHTKNLNTAILHTIFACWEMLES